MFISVKSSCQVSVVALVVISVSIAVSVAWRNQSVVVAEVICSCLV